MSRKNLQHITLNQEVKTSQSKANNTFLTAEEAAILAEAYRSYRTEVHRLALKDQKAIIADDQFNKERTQVAQVWNTVLEQGVEQRAGESELNENHE